MYTIIKDRVYIYIKGEALMECIRCGYEFRYVDRRYPTRIHEKDRVVIHYRCRSCYKEHKRELRNRFKRRVVRE